MSAKEESIVLPLSGEQILNAITYEIRKSLQLQCHLNPALAYSGFRAEIYGKLVLDDLGREVEIPVDVKAALGEAPDDPDGKFLREFDTRLGLRPPNEVLQESGQEVPVAVPNPETGKKDVKLVRQDRARLKK